MRFEASSGALNALLRSGESVSTMATTFSGGTSEIRSADALAGVGQRNRPAIGRRLQAVIDVVHAFERQRLPRVHFQNHALGLLDPGLVVADRRTRNHPAILQHGRDLDQREIQLAQEAVLHELSHVAQVDVHVLHLAGVDALASLGIRLIRQPQMNAARHGERAVELRPGGGAGENADLKLLSAQVSVGDAARQRHGNCLGIAGAGESAHADSGRRSGSAPQLLRRS